MNSRKDARQAVAALMATLPDLADTSFDHEVLQPPAQSPFSTTQSFGTQPTSLTLAGEFTRAHAIIITLYWLWTDTTEDGLDDLSEAAYDVIEANQELDGVWQSLQLDDGFTETGYETMKGETYRFERIRVIIW